MTQEQYIEQYKLLSEYALPNWATVALVVAAVFIVGGVLSFVCVETDFLLYKVTGAFCGILLGCTAFWVLNDELNHIKLPAEIATLKSAYIAESPHKAYPVIQIETKDGTMTALVDVGDRYELVSGFEKMEKTSGKNYVSAVLVEGLGDYELKDGLYDIKLYLSSEDQAQVFND